MVYTAFGVATHTVRRLCVRACERVSVQCVSVQCASVQCASTQREAVHESNSCLTLPRSTDQWDIHVLLLHSLGLPRKQ